MIPRHTMSRFIRRRDLLPSCARFLLSFSAFLAPACACECLAALCRGALRLSSTSP